MSFIYGYQTHLRSRGRSSEVEASVTLLGEAAAEIGWAAVHGILLEHVIAPTAVSVSATAYAITATATAAAATAVAAAFIG